MKLLRKRKSKFYREFMLNLIKNIIAVILGLSLLIGTVYWMIYIIIL